MIRAEFFRNRDDDIYGFCIRDHGDSIVCAAVSALAINCINCIEKFTDYSFTLDRDVDGGYIFIEVPFIKDGGYDYSIELIFNCLLLGLMGIEAKNKNDITIAGEEV